MDKTLSSMVALVTGASRGVGRGIAIGLGEAGATVFVTGRTSTAMSDQDNGTVEESAQQVTEAGGRGIAVVCDHTVDEQVDALFSRVVAQSGRLDVLVNNVWGGYEELFTGGEYTWEMPFWRQSLRHWDKMFRAGVRAHYAASRYAAPMMIDRGRGLIVNISFWAAKQYVSNVAYGVSKAATDKMTLDMAHELEGRGVTVVSLYPGLVRTERVTSAQDHLDLQDSESPLFVGRAVAALAADPSRERWTGQILTTAQLADEYGFEDINE